jgi:cytochrome c oxidase subunit 2
MWQIKCNRFKTYKWDFSPLEIPSWAYFNLQDSSSPLIEQLIYFHDHTIIILILITAFLAYKFTIIIIRKFSDQNLLEGQTIEIVWTIIPALILIFIALPSLRILYLTDEVKEPSITIKTMGHQWYWSYEYSDFTNLEFDSYITPTEDIKTNELRLLEVDNRLVIPFNSQIRILIRAADVIHSWTIPSLGVKADAIPGRLNQINFSCNRSRIFYGQCSEICGANHSFIPIVIERISPKTFINWIKSIN